MKKIIVIPNCVFIDIKRGQKAIIDNIFRLLYSMFESDPKQIDFHLTIGDSIGRVDAKEITMTFGEEEMKLDTKE